MTQRRGNGQGDESDAATAQSRSDTEYPGWWPSGCDESFVRDCNCDHCLQMAAALDEWRDGIAPTGDATLDSFASS